jgi:hypothetical protein
VLVAVKDLCYTKGVGTTGRGSFLPDIGASVASRLRDTGAALPGAESVSRSDTTTFDVAKTHLPKPMIHPEYLPWL